MTGKNNLSIFNWVRDGPFFRLFSVFSVFAVVGVVVVVIFTLHGIIFSLFGIYVKFLNNALHVAAYCCSEALRMCESAEA